MRTRYATPVLLGLWVLASSAAAAGEPPKPPPLRVHVISGSKEYQSEPSLKAFIKGAEAKHDIRFTASWGQDRGKDLPDTAKIKDADVLLVFARRMVLPEEQMAAVRAHWEAGKPVVGVRTASHAFSDEENKTFDRKVLGGDHQSHYDDEPVEVRATEAGRGHPVLKGVRPIVSRKLYKVGEMAPGVTVLQTGTIALPGGQRATQPVTWTHEYNGGRVFYTSLGVPEDFAGEDFRRMLTNALVWAAKREPGRR